LTGSIGLKYFCDTKQKKPAVLLRLKTLTFDYNYFLWFMIPEKYGGGSVQETDKYHQKMMDFDVK